jgi:hypothetical protein
MFKKVAFVITCLIASGCADYSARPFLNRNVDCGNGKRMMTYELCRLDAFGY